MKKQNGFTLIELVIVIIILGILAATAVPKFVDLQTDARESMMKGAKGALEGAATVIHAKAAVDGKLKDATEDVDGVAVVYGYPDATSAALGTAANLDSNDWTITGTPAVITIPGYTGGTCQVTYTLGTSPARPSIVVDDSGC